MQKGSKFEALAAKVGPLESGIMAVPGLRAPGELSAEEELTELVAREVAAEVDAVAIENPKAFVDLLDALRVGRDKE